MSAWQTSYAAAMDHNAVADTTITNVANTLLYLSELRDAATDESDRSFIASLSAPLVKALETLERHPAASA